jgi:hypothetical protein
MNHAVSVRFDSAVTRTALAKGVALDLAGGNSRRLRPTADGGYLVVNHPDFDTRAWEQPKARKGKKRNA